MPDIDRDMVVELTRDLIRFPSVNPPGDEQEVAEFLWRHMKDCGLEVEAQPLTVGRMNVIGRLRGSGSGHLVLTGHLDVVPPGEQPWSHGAFDADLTDGRVYGRGSADMKGGVAAMVTAAAALAQSGFRPSADLVIAATAGEEAGLYGARAMVRGRSLQGSRYLVVGEPTDLNVFIGEKGVLWVDVQAYGRTAHGSMPWLGSNAISYISRLIPRLEAYPFPYSESELLGKPTLSVNVIRGGNKTNVVPDACRISLDMRTVPSQSHAELLDGLRSLAEEVAQDFGSAIKVQVEPVQDDGPVETPRSEPLVDAMEAAVQSVRGQEPNVTGVTYATDAAVLGPGFDIPMVICGPGAPGMAHQPDEYVEVEQLTQAAQIYANLAEQLLG